MSAASDLDAHRRTILLPPRIAEYVVVHELVHVAEVHHAPAFWARVERKLPDYTARMGWLAEKGDGVAGA